MSAIPGLSAAEQQQARRQLRALTKELEEAKTRSAKERGTMSELEFLRDCREQVGMMQKIVPLILLMYGQGKRGKKSAPDINGQGRKRHSNRQGRSERDAETGAEADDGEQAWQEHIRRCSEYRKMVAERDNQPVRGGKGETKERTAGVDHTWRSGGCAAKKCNRQPTMPAVEQLLPNIGR